MKRQGYRVDHDFAHTEIPTRTELSQRLLKNGYEDIVFMPAREGNKHRNVDVYCLESISSAAG